MGGDFNVGVTRLGKGKYTFQFSEEYEEYDILGEMLQRLPNKEDTWFSKLGQGCIDTIFYSNNIDLIKYETVESEKKSDHNIVYSEFNI